MHLSERNDCLWSYQQLPQALTALARFHGWRLRPLSAAAISPLQEQSPDQQIQNSSRLAGLSTEQIVASVSEATALLQSTAPALFAVPDAEPGAFILVVRRRRGHLQLLGNDLRLHRVPTNRVAEWLNAASESDPALRRLLEQIPPRRRQRAQTILSAHQTKQRITGWHFQPEAISWFQQLRHNGGWRALLTSLGAHATQYGLLLLAWWVIGHTALIGRFDDGWFWLWVLLLAALVPLRMALLRCQGLFAIAAGTILKRRLLQNALQQDPAVISRQGIGHIIGRVFESDTIKNLALNGGFMTLLAALESLVAGWIMGLGSGGVFAVSLWGGWLAFSMAGVVWYYRRRNLWTAKRLRMTEELVEKMVGHRTRIAQLSLDQPHREEDSALADYLTTAQRLDRAAVWLQSLIPRGWLPLGLLGLSPTLLTATPDVTLSLAVGLGGLLLGYQALQRLVLGLSELAAAVVAWHSIADYLRPHPATPPALIPHPVANSERAAPLLYGSNLSFSYPQSSPAVIEQCHLTIQAGDRLLLTGASGSGKSTLVALLSGLEQPASGVLLLHGLDYATLGQEGWRCRIATAPQFHQNHVLANTFLFNLLLGSDWPPSRQQLVEAETVCEELGLSPLLARMPAGLNQNIGETGWQLSHGERSRLYIARTLLQQAELIILDESFAALDPENLEQAVQCVLRRAATVLVVAHP